MVIQTVYDQFCQNWYNELALSSKLDTLKTLNKCFKFEKYLACLNIEKKTVSLSLDSNVQLIN